MTNEEKHWKSGTRIYSIWSNMIQRCANPKNTNYPNYGAKGVFVCDRWLNSFKLFYEDMGHLYSDNLTIDRINCKDGYFLENCRWVTISEQQHNKTTSHIITANGESKTLSTWSKELGFGASTIRSRIKAGMTPEEAVLTPKKLFRGQEEFANKVIKSKYKVIKFSIDGNEISSFESLKEAAIQTGFSKKAICNNIYGLSKSCNGFIFKKSQTTLLTIQKRYQWKIKQQ